MNGIDPILRRLRFLADPKAVEGMARYGIVAKNVLGIPLTKLRALAQETGNDHRLAQGLWDTGIHEARIIAIFIEEPGKVTERQMERWAGDFDNWAICDGCCLHLFERTPYAWKKAVQWSMRKEEFVRRAGFALMAVLAVHDKEAGERKFTRLLSLVRKASTDERNGVKKAVNWALRQIGKRSLSLNKKAVRAAEEIRKQDSPAARWIASDALRELTGTPVLNRLRRKAGRGS